MFDSIILSTQPDVGSGLMSNLDFLKLSYLFYWMIKRHMCAMCIIWKFTVTRDHHFQSLTSGRANERMKAVWLVRSSHISSDGVFDILGGWSGRRKIIRTIHLWAFDLGNVEIFWAPSAAIVMEKQRFCQGFGRMSIYCLGIWWVSKNSAKPWQELIHLWIVDHPGFQNNLCQLVQWTGRPKDKEPHGERYLEPTNILNKYGHFFEDT